MVCSRNDAALRTHNMRYVTYTVVVSFSRQQGQIKQKQQDTYIHTYILLLRQGLALALCVVRALYMQNELLYLYLQKKKMRAGWGGMWGLCPLGNTELYKESVR